LMIVPSNSIGAKINFIGTGTWHPENVSPVIFVSRKSCDQIC
jgi:hypothetical protein